MKIFLSLTTTSLLALSTTGAHAQLFDVPFINAYLDVSLYIDYEALNVDTTTAGVTTNATTETFVKGLAIEGRVDQFYLDVVVYEDETYTGSVAFGGRWGVVTSGSTDFDYLNDGDLSLAPYFTPQAHSAYWIASAAGTVGALATDLNVPSGERLSFTTPEKNDLQGEIGLAGDVVYGAIAVAKDNWGAALMLEEDRIAITSDSAMRFAGYYQAEKWSGLATYESISNTAGSTAEVGLGFGYEFDFGDVYAVTNTTDADNRMTGLGVTLDKWDIFTAQGTYKSQDLDDFTMTRVTYDFRRIQVGGEVWSGTPTLATAPAETIALFAKPYEGVSISLSQDSNPLTGYEKQTKLALEIEVSL